MSSKDNFKDLERILQRKSLPVLQLPGADRFRMPRRDAPEGIMQEARAILDVASIPVGPHTSLEIGTTFAAAPHSPFGAPARVIEEAYRMNASRYGFTVPEGNILPGEAGPLNFNNWVFFKQYGTLMPVDWYDMLGSKIAINESKELRYQLLLHDAQLSAVFAELDRRNEFTTMVLLDIYNNYVLPQLNAVMEAEYGITDAFPPRKVEDVTLYMAVGHHRGDPGRGLLQSKMDGLGGGPQSSPSVHNHVNMKLRFQQLVLLSKRINEVRPNAVAETPASILQTLQAHYNQGAVPQHVFLGEFSEVPILIPEDGVANPALNNLVEDIVKQVDPYGTALYQVLGGWMEKQLQQYFGKESKVRKFLHHSKASDPIIRSAEGVDILTRLSFTDNMIRLGDFLEQMALVWQETELALKFFTFEYLYKGEDSLQGFKEVQRRYKLPTAYIEFVSRLRPTEKQLKLWRSEAVARAGEVSGAVAALDNMLGQYQIDKQRIYVRLNELMYRLSTEDIERSDMDDLKELLTLFLQGQIFDDLSLNDHQIYRFNTGFNFPGLPGFGVSFFRDYKEVFGQTRIVVGILSSLKGIAEQYMGVIVRRQQRRG